MSAGDGEPVSPSGSATSRFYIAKDDPDADSNHRHSWIELLGVDLDYLQTLPFAPLGVVQYALYCITNVRGFLSVQHSRDTAQGVERLDPRGTPHPLNYYYHYENINAIPQMIPLDAWAELRLTMTSASAESFREDVQSRDNACVISDYHAHTQACHLIPHSSGDELRLIAFGHKTVEQPFCESTIPETGLMLEASLHIGLSQQEFCFLPVPNHVFALIDGEQDKLLPSNSPLTLSELDQTKPATVLITSPKVESPSIALGATMGKPCRLYPGRSLGSGTKSGESDIGQEETTSKQPEIWLLDAVLSACFLRWFGSRNADLIKELGKDVHEQIDSAMEAARKENSQADPGNNSDSGRKRNRSPDSEGKDTKGGAKRREGQRNLSGGNNQKNFAQLDRGSQMLAIALAFPPTPEAWRRSEAEIEEERELSVTTQDRLVNWLHGQTRR